MTFNIHRIINSLNYRLIDPLTRRDSRNWSSKTDSRKMYSKALKALRASHSTDEAARMAVGGEFNAIGLLSREILIYHGLRKHDYLIDVGCGSGRLTKPLCDYLEGDYLGIDVVPELIDYARKLVKRPDWSFQVTRGLTIPEQDNKADMVCFFSVLTHLLHEESYTYLSEAKRVLKPGGKIVLSFLDFRIHWSVFQSNLKDIGIGSQPMNVFISVDMLREWAKHLDLEVELIKDGDDPYLPLREPIAFENGDVVKERVAFGQSICVLVRR